MAPPQRLFPLPGEKDAALPVAARSAPNKNIGAKA